MTNDIEKLAVKSGFIPHVANDGECYADLETLKQFAEAYAAKVLEDKEREITELKANNNQLREALEELLVAYRVAVKLYDLNHDDAYTVKAHNAIAKARNIKWK